MRQHKLFVNVGYLGLVRVSAQHDTNPTMTRANPRIGENHEYENSPKRTVPAIAPPMSHVYARKGAICEKKFPMISPSGKNNNPLSTKMSRIGSVVELVPA